MIQSFAYDLDDMGNRTKLTVNGGDYIEYEYDPLYQLTKEHRKTSGAATQYWNEFYYDYISNRTKLRHNDGTSTTATTYSYNASDQLTRDITGATTTDYSYDANGALTRKSSGGNNYDYLYDARSLITKYDAPGASSDTTYDWDLLERRIKKDVNSSVTRFLYDDSIGEVLAEYDGSGTPVLQAGYIPNGFDSNVSMTRGGTVYYFHTDSIQSSWSLTLATDESVQNTYAYQGFGNQYGTPTEGISNTRRFTGAEWNGEDSTQTHGVRRYFTGLGRWNRRDPMLDIDSSNLQSYVANNPVLSTDPTGYFRWPWDDGLSCESNQEGHTRYNQFKNPCPGTRTWRQCGRKERCSEGRWYPAGRTICSPCPPKPGGGGGGGVKKCSLIVLACVALAEPTPVGECVVVGECIRRSCIIGVVCAGVIVQTYETAKECVRRIPPQGKPKKPRKCHCWCSQGWPYSEFYVGYIEVASCLAQGCSCGPQPGPNPPGPKPFPQPSPN